MNQAQLFLEDFEKRYTTKAGKETDDSSKIEKAIFSLKGNEASEVTKLTKQLEEIKAQEKELKAKKASLECKARDICDALSDAEDIVLTRVMETASVITTIAKMTSSVSVKWKEAFEEMSEKFAPEIVEQMNEIIKAYTTVTDKKPTVTTKVKKESFSDWVQKGVEGIKKFFTNIISWAKGYDEELEDFKKRYGLENEE